MKIDWNRLVSALAASAPPEGPPVNGWSVDSRTLVPGDLFFALPGHQHDGHNYVTSAFHRGAAAAVVERVVPEAAPLLIVDDTLAALQRLAAWARREWAGQIVGVTGSSGKTTTKDMIAHVLSPSLPTGKTEGNYNNHIGVPLSMLRLAEDCRAAVLEMGMNHAGEIRALAAIARPNIGVVTNIGYAHIEYFDSIDGIAAAKRELIESLPADGIAVLNADDPRVVAFREVHPGRSILYGIDAGEVRPEQVELGAAHTRFRFGGQQFETSATGRHNLLNWMAAFAVAQAYEIPPTLLVEPVRSFRTGAMRCERIEHGGAVIWNDCYNANPEAMRFMIDLLADTPARRRIAVLGEMLELGRSSAELHRHLGRYIAERRIDLLLGVRGGAREMVEEAARAGIAARFFEDPVAAGDFAAGVLEPGDALLFKGSRGVRVERALERVLAPAGVR